MTLCSGKGKKKSDFQQFHSKDFFFFLPAQEAASKSLTKWKRSAETLNAQCCFSSPAIACELLITFYTAFSRVFLNGIVTDCGILNISVSHPMSDHSPDRTWGLSLANTAPAGPRPLPAPCHWSVN